MPIHVCQYTPRKNTSHTCWQSPYFLEIYLFIYMGIYYLSTTARCATHTMWDGLLVNSLKCWKRKISRFSSNHLCKHRTEPQSIQKASSKFCVCNSSEDSVTFFSSSNGMALTPAKRYGIAIGSCFDVGLAFAQTNIRQFCIRVIHCVAFLTFKLLTENQFA